MPFSGSARLISLSVLFTAYALPTETLFPKMPMAAGLSEPLPELPALPVFSAFVPLPALAELPEPFAPLPKSSFPKEPFSGFSTPGSSFPGVLFPGAPFPGTGSWFTLIRIPHPIRSRAAAEIAAPIKIIFFTLFQSFRVM